MPKEVVYGNKFSITSPITGKSVDEVEDPVVEVRWSRESGDIQIVTRLKGCEIAGSDEELTCKYGMYVDLNRRGINDLIRYLRRARDQAFGRDE